MKFFRKVTLGLCPQTDFYSSRRQDDLERPVMGAKSGARSDRHGRTLTVICRRVNGWKDCLVAPKRPDGFPPQGGHGVNSRNETSPAENGLVLT